MASAITTLTFLGISGVLIRKQTDSFFAEHENRIEEGAKRDAILTELQQDRRSMAREVAGIRFLIAAAAVSAFSITLGLVWRRRISRPMALLSDQIHKMRLGTWSQPMPVNQEDEIGTLMRQFNDLGPELAFTAHQYAAASKLAAMALVGQRVVRRTMAAQQRLLAVSESLNRAPDAEQFRRMAVEQVRLVAADLESVAVDFDAEFQAELARVGSTRGLPETTDGPQAAA